jgi:PKD repeat protein
VTGLNNNGDIVGYAPSPVGTGFRYTAVLWRGGKAINLGFFPGGTSSIAYDINDSGQIVGEGSVVPDGPMHALLWTVGGAANQPPVAKASATPTSGTAPLAVNFSSAGSSDPDGTITSYAWTFGDGGTSTAANPSHNYASAGTFTATLTVTDNSGATASKSVTITATATASVLRSTDITLTATRVLSSVTVTGKVTVKNQSSAVVSGATVAITWKLPNGSTKTATATTNSSGVATFTVKSGRGTYKLTVNNLTKTGYTFDAANSVLTKSITK